MLKLIFLEEYAHFEEASRKEYDHKKAHLNECFRRFR